MQNAQPRRGPFSRAARRPTACQPPADPTDDAARPAACPWPVAATRLPARAARRPPMIASAAWRAPVAPLLCLGAYALGLARGPWPLVAASLFGLLLYASQAASRRVAPWAFA